MARTISMAVCVGWLLLGAFCAGVFAQAPPAGPPPEAASDMAATVNGVAITMQEVDAAAGDSLARLQRQVRELRRIALDGLIERALLASEAEKRGITVDALVRAEITDAIVTPTEADVQQFVEANQARLADREDRQAYARTLLIDERRGTRRSAFLRTLRERATIALRLPSSSSPADASVRTDGAPVKGPATARVTIVEFSDFHCPYCRRVQPTLDAVLRRYPDRVRLVYRHLPLDIHPHARTAARAAWCAQQQDRFWPMHDKLFASAPSLTDTALRAMAKDVGLDVTRFVVCVGSPESDMAVAADEREARTQGINATPVFLINGRRVGGNRPIGDFVAAIEEALAQPAAVQPAAARPDPRRDE